MPSAYPSLSLRQKIKNYFEIRKERKKILIPSPIYLPNHKPRPLIRSEGVGSCIVCGKTRYRHLFKLHRFRAPKYFCKHEVERLAKVVWGTMQVEMSGWGWAPCGECPYCKKHYSLEDREKILEYWQRKRRRGDRWGLPH